MKTLEVFAHINSLHGEKRQVTLLGPNYLFGRAIPNAYIFRYNNTLCGGIFNTFIFEYYVDDKFDVITENNENYRIYKKYLKEIKR